MRENNIDGSRRIVLHFPYWSPMDSLLGKDGIFVMHPRYKTNPEEKYYEYFEEIIPLKGVNNTEIEFTPTFKT